MPKLSNLKDIIEIQDFQFRLDSLKKRQAIIKSEIKSLQFKIPKKIRELNL